MLYKIQEIDSLAMEAKLPKGLISKVRGDISTISFGCKKVSEVTISDHNSLDSIVFLSKNLIKELKIPIDLLFQMIAEDQQIRIGPVIGLLMARNSKTITKDFLKRLDCYTYLYKEFQGLLYAFSEESIDVVNLTAKGFYYNPTDEMEWVAAEFPIADSIYRRVSITGETLESLKNVTKGRFFNTDYFNKLDFYKMVKDTSFNKYIPYTKVFEGFSDLFQTLEAYPKVYMKLIDGSWAHGIIKIEKLEDCYSIQCRDDEAQALLSSDIKAMDYLTKRMSKGKYLIQQGINSVIYNNRQVDFRVIMQKDYTLDWQCTGIVAILGRAGGITSNRGYSMTLQDFFTAFNNMTKKDIFLLEKRLTDVCKGICKLIDKGNENYGDLGIDVLIDYDLNIWILEINKRHNHFIPLALNDWQTYYSVKNNPIKYALGQSGYDMVL